MTKYYPPLLHRIDEDVDESSDIGLKSCRAVGVTLSLTPSDDPLICTQGILRSATFRHHATLIPLARMPPLLSFI